MPAAARATDMHACPVVAGAVAHVGGPLMAACTSVLIDNLPAAVVGDKATCAVGVANVVIGEATVLVEHKPAAHLGSTTSHGGVVVMGSPTVLVGTPAQGRALVRAAESGSPFCAVCAE